MLLNSNYNISPLFPTLKDDNILSIKVIRECKTKYTALKNELDKVTPNTALINISLHIPDSYPDYEVLLLMKHVFFLK